MTNFEIELLHFICDRMKDRAWKGSPEQFLKLIKADEEVIGVLQNQNFRDVLHGWGIALWFSRCDSLIRCIDTTIKKLPRYVWGPGQCQFCGLREEYPEIDLVPDIDNGERIEGQGVHKCCQRPLMRLRGKLRLIERRKREAKLA